MTRRALRCGLTAGVVVLVLDFAVPYAVALAVPGYSHTAQFMSEIAAESTALALVMGAWWVSYGLVLTAFAYSVYRVVPAQGISTGIACGLLGVAGLGLGVGGGLFPCDTGCAGSTTSGRLHTLSAVVGSIGLVLSPFFMWLALYRVPGWSRAAWASAIGATLGLAVFIGFMEASSAGPQPGSTRGLWQRVFLAVYYLWLAALTARSLAALAERDRRRPEAGA